MTSRVTEFDKLFAANIREMRTAALLTQPQVAAHLGITYQSYQKMEGGKHAFRYSTMAKLAQLYDVPVQNLIAGADNPDPVVVRCVRLLHQMDAHQLLGAFEALLAIRDNTNGRS